MKSVSITMLKKMAKEKDLVVIPRATYESLKADAESEYTPTKADLRAIRRGEVEYREGKTVSLEEALRALER